MKYSDSHRGRSAGGGRSGRAALNPYYMEDIALTPRDLDRARSIDTRIITPR